MGTNANKKNGNSFEAEFCEMLAKNGFWAHNMAQNQAGQPADVLAVRNGKAYLIDCKLCSAKGFSLDRIEPNQETAMDLWESCGNPFGIFAVKHKDKVFMMSLFTREQLRDEGISSVGVNLFPIVGIPFERWVEMCE